MMSLSQGHFLLVPSVSWYGQAAVDLRYSRSLNSTLVVPQRCLWLALGLPLYLIFLFWMDSGLSSRTRPLMSLFPSLSPNACIMMCAISEFCSHSLDQLVCLPRVSALSASMRCRCLVYRVSGGMPSSRYIAASGVFVSNPYALRMMFFRTVCASVIGAFVFQTSIP